MIQITDATDGSVLATSDPAPSGDNDWSRIELQFKTGPKTQAVTTKVVREPCGENQILPDLRCGMV